MRQNRCRSENIRDKVAYHPMWKTWWSLVRWFEHVWGKSRKASIKEGTSYRG